MIEHSPARDAAGAGDRAMTAARVSGNWGGAVARADGSDSVLAAIRRGERVDATIHDAVHAEDHVLEVDSFCLWYGSTQALHDITMPIPRGKVTALLGPSGCGKSTLLRSVNRLNDLIDGVRATGDLRLNGSSVYGPRVDVIDLRKRLGMVFQKPNPFPMSIFENVVYPLRIDGVRKKGVLREACEQALRGAALWDEVKDRLTSRRSGSRAGSSSGCASRGRSSRTPRCCCWTSPARRSTRSRRSGSRS
jgi:phosphate transport system ATP-binding protein